MSIVIVFFFKQNTAYEMRISDWSSDVCSSDLAWFPCRRRSGTACRRAAAGGCGTWPSEMLLAVGLPPRHRRRDREGAENRRNRADELADPWSSRAEKKFLGKSSCCGGGATALPRRGRWGPDRKSTRLNSRN